MCMRSGVINTRPARVIISLLCSPSYLFFLFFLIERPFTMKAAEALSITRENKYSVCKRFLCVIPLVPLRSDSHSGVRAFCDSAQLIATTVMNYQPIALREKSPTVSPFNFERYTASAAVCSGMCFRTMDGIKAIRIRESQFNPGRVSHHWAEENCWVIVLQYSA